MTLSMTGFAARRGEALGYAWGWDIRSVNGKGLELRLRMPEWIEGLEAHLRADLQKALGRGNVSLSLRLSRQEGAAPSLRLNRDMLRAVLKALNEVEAAAGDCGTALVQANAADVLTMRGVMENITPEEDYSALREVLVQDFAPLVQDFIAMRAAEGAALHAIITAQLDEVEALLAQAVAAAEARRPQVKSAMAAAIARLGQDIATLDPARVAQELALLAVKQDVAEEVDRLRAHISAARALLADSAPVGRKFDFLMQEFLREANTLLSKSQDIELTRIGLDLKTVIDQMREQVQNVE